MDNLTHTLVGAALARAGLQRRTALGAATLMIGANLPDVDAITMFGGDALGFRRGVTHGVLAIVLLPFLLAGLMLAWDRLVRRARDRLAAPADARQLLLLAAIGVFTHPVLDYMNTYGMRWLMPFVDRWYYGDMLFIIDLWMWLVLGAGVAAAGVLWRRGHPRAGRPARVALVIFAAYAMVMIGITQHAEHVVRREYGAGGAALQGGRRIMASPLPLLSWRRDVVVDEGDRFGRWRYAPFAPPLRGESFLKGDTTTGALALARAMPETRSFLHWARFPYYEYVASGADTVVVVRDARYATRSRTGFAVFSVRVPGGAPGPQDGPRSNLAAPAGERSIVP